MQDALRIVGPFHASSGYSKFCRAALTTARLAGFRVQAVESDFRLSVQGFADGTRKEGRLPKSDLSKVPELQAEELREAEAVELPADAPTLLVQLPVQLSGWAEYSTGPRLGWTMIESDTLHPLWARAACNVDELLLPSRFCAETFRKALPGVSQDVLPLPVDPRLYSPEGPQAAIGDRPDFLFFSTFATCERKGWRLLMQAMAEEFVGESVGLMVLPSRAPEVFEFADWCRNAGLWVQVVGEWVSEEDLAGLYRACDAFALPSAEGFGLPFVEAAMCGKPSVALSLGGAADIVSEATGYPVEAYLAPCVGHLPPLYDSRQNFPTATIEAVRSALRACVEDRGGKGEAAREFALAHFTPAAIAPGLREAIEEAVCRFEVEKKVWQGAGVRELPKLAILIHVSDTQRAQECCSDIEATVKSASIFYVTTNAEDTDFLSGAIFSENLALARQDALQRLKDYGFDGFVALISDTVSLDFGWWEGLTKVFALRPDVGILSPMRTFADGVVRVGGHLRFNGERSVGKLRRTVVTCDYVDQSFLVMRPEVWQNVEIDPQFDWFYADADLSVQARRLGYETAATAAVSVQQSQGSREKDYLKEPMRQAFLRKWRGDF